MPWRPLREFDDPRVPKLDNLRRAAARGLRVPDTKWLWAKERSAEDDELPDGVLPPLIVRSGSPTEDTKETSNAGQLLSLRVLRIDGFAEALDRVIGALPAGDDGRPDGAVFVQPLVVAEEAGVAFFDGFYFERAAARGSNEGLTSGQARGDVVRGHLARDDAWSDFLGAVFAVFGHGDGASNARGNPIDIEFAKDGEGHVLLQVRPALFPLAKNETLSLANHKEILGDPPSPWIVGVVVEAGKEALSFFTSIDPEVDAWGEAYAVELEDRAWMNFSFFFRLMDHWGLPRAFVTQGVGGQGGGPADARVVARRFVRSIPRLLRLQWRSLAAVRRAPRALRALDLDIDAASTLGDIYRANVRAMSLAIQTNFAINGILSGMTRVRKALRVGGTARVVTQEMMERYSALSLIQDAGARERALDVWLSEFGHRGPLESDPARPRFAEMRDVLVADLETAHVRAGSLPDTQHQAPPTSRSLFFWIDRRREWFRDELMRRWKRIRARALEEGTKLVGEGVLAAAEDVFLFRGDPPAGAARAAVDETRARLSRASDQVLPLTASRDAIERALAEDESLRIARAGRKVFRGISLGPAVIEGPVIKAYDLTTLLVESSRMEGGIDPTAILVVAALEPSWAVVFPRVQGVIAEIGGELSHASILLREARRPAVVNCEGIFSQVKTGDRLRLDGVRGLVELLDG